MDPNEQQNRPETPEPEPQPSTSGTFQSDANDAMRCLESFSTWPNFVDHTETGQLYRRWFYTPPPEEFSASRGERKRKSDNTENNNDSDSHSMPPPATPAPMQAYPSLPPPMIPQSIQQHHTFTGPVFPTPRGIPVTSTVTSGSVVIAGVRPQFVEPEFVWSTHGMPYPPQRPRIIQAPGTCPRYPPPDQNNFNT